MRLPFELANAEVPEGAGLGMFADGQPFEPETGQILGLEFGCDLSRQSALGLIEVVAHLEAVQARNIQGSPPL